MVKINRYWNSDPSELVDRKEHETYELCKCCEIVNQLERMLKKERYEKWIARAERASDRARIFYFVVDETKLDIEGYSYDSKKKKDCKKLDAREWRIIWLKVERKCRAKAEKFKLGI